MRSLKLALIAAAAVALFALACNNASNTAGNASGTQPNANTIATHTGANANTANIAASANAAPTDELAGARQIYGERCTKCHGANADGGRVEFDNIKLKVPGLREGHARTHTAQQLAKRISNGGEGMPAFKDKLKPEEINALVRLIREEFQEQTAAANAPVAPNSH